MPLLRVFLLFSLPGMDPSPIMKTAQASLRSLLFSHDPEEIAESLNHHRVAECEGNLQSIGSRDNRLLAVHLDGDVRELREGDRNEVVIAICFEQGRYRLQMGASIFRTVVQLLPDAKRVKVDAAGVFAGLNPYKLPE